MMEQRCAANTELKAENMTRQFVQQMADGHSIEDVYLVADKQLRANRNGNLYLQLDLHDRTGSINARLWNAGEHLFVRLKPATSCT